MSAIGNQPDTCGTCEHRRFEHFRMDRSCGVDGCDCPRYRVASAPDEPRLERIAEIVYDAMRANDPEGEKYPWVVGGNSQKQDDARVCARRVLEVIQQSPDSATEQRGQR